MLPNQDDDDKTAPKLQLEFAGGGPGSIARTAVGAAGGDNFLSGAWLPYPPWWFFCLDKKQRSLCRNRFHPMPLNEAFACLEAAGVPPISRLAVGLKWGFINPNENGFSRQDLKELIVDAKLGVDPSIRIAERYSSQPGIVEMIFEMQLESIESAVAYKLWRYERGIKKAKVS
jgi:hypothetical protein